MKKPCRPADICAHLGDDYDRYLGAIVPPLFQNTLFTRKHELEELLPLLMKDKLLAKGVSHLLSSQLTRILRTHAAMSVLGHGLLRGAGLGGPVGAALNGVKAVSGSAYRVTIPAVLQIACLRRMVSATQV